MKAHGAHRLKDWWASTKLKVTVKIIKNKNVPLLGTVQEKQCGKHVLKIGRNLKL
jgi:hypothetical protein